MKKRNDCTKTQNRDCTTFYCVVKTSADVSHYFTIWSPYEGWKLLLNPHNIVFSNHYELYNVWSDPSESVNLVATHPELFHSMKNQMQELINQMIPQDSPDNVHGWRRKFSYRLVLKIDNSENSILN